MEALRLQGGDNMQVDQVQYTPPYYASGGAAIKGPCSASGCNGSLALGRMRTESQNSLMGIEPAASPPPRSWRSPSRPAQARKSSRNQARWGLAATVATQMTCELN
jgi:hypothetical protein